MKAYTAVAFHAIWRPDHESVHCSSFSMQDGGQLMRGCTAVAFPCKMAARDLESVQYSSFSMQDGGQIMRAYTSVAFTCKMAARDHVSVHCSCFSMQDGGQRS